MNKASFLFALSICLLLLACQDSRKPVQLLIEKDGKKYLFSKSDVQDYLDRNESPSVFFKEEIIVKKDSFYIQVNDIEYFYHLISGNFVFYPYQEKSFDGYVTVEDRNLFSQKNINETTDKIGENLRRSKVTLKHPYQLETMEIEWQSYPRKKAIKNCERQAIVVSTQTDDGTSYSKHGELVVNLQRLIDFSGEGVSIRYEKSKKLLFFVVN